MATYVITKALVNSGLLVKFLGSQKFLLCGFSTVRGSVPLSPTLPKVSYSSKSLMTMMKDRLDAFTSIIRVPIPALPQENVQEKAPKYI